MRSEKVFQFTWATLHFAAAILHFGSGVYHIARCAKQEPV